MKVTMLRTISTYGLSVRAGIGNKIRHDLMVFNRLPNTHKYDALHTGATSDIFEMEGTGKQYRVTITPLPETHGVKTECKL